MWKFSSLHAKLHVPISMISESYRTITYHFLSFIVFFFCKRNRIIGEIFLHRNIMFLLIDMPGCFGVLFSVHAIQFVKKWDSNIAFKNLAYKYVPIPFDSLVYRYWSWFFYLWENIITLSVARFWGNINFTIRLRRIRDA